ncbi:MAG: DnaJ domain-containing protein [Chlorobi bacterium]|nr:DnaJ domain-containing protein [Chlorobiota bacterium]
MAKYGKWIGLGLGVAMAGPLGAVLGFVFGSMYDKMQDGDMEYKGGDHPYSGTPGGVKQRMQPGDFAASLVVLSAAVMKADGKVVRSELDFVKQFFYKQFGQELANDNIHILREVIKQDVNIKDVSLQISRFMDYPSRLQLLHYLFGISMADGYVHAKEVEMISSISGYLGVSNSDFASVKGMFYKDINSAYQVLEIASAATDDEVKKAYRSMAIKYHPDKVSHLGEEFRVAAKEKFQKLNEAYEQIKKERGMK